MPPLAERKRRILIVDDHPMVREGLASMLEGEVGELAQAGTGEEALSRVREIRPDLVLLDLKLPDLDGLTVLQRVKALAPETSVVIVTMHDDPEFIRRAVELGAAGYVLKGITRRELVATVGAVCEGESVLAPDALRRLLGEVARASAAGAGGPGPTGLAEVERDVLAMLADGRTNKEIAQQLRWSVGSVKKCVQRLLKVLEVSDRTQAAVEAVRRKLVE
jgi:DNA-binding NarL/FixJ family response regulator